MMIVHHADTQAETTSKTVFGFWVYLMTDCILFGTLFATYAVLHTATNGGPGARELFHLPFALTETLILLTSSFTCGLAMLAAHRGNKNQVVSWLAVTFVLGIAFLSMELTEFTQLAEEGNTWARSAFLSAFFTLVSTHGLHITVGLLWIIFMLLIIYNRGLRPTTMRRLTCFSLFWHFLDVVWIFIFTVVYLMGE